MLESRWSKLFDAVLGGAVAVLVLAMMLVTSIDVVGRYLLNSPLSGAFEMTELMLAALIFLGLPLTTQRNEHITVDLLDPVMSEKVVNTQVIVMNWLCALILGVLSWQLWIKAHDLVQDGSVTNTLEVPLAPFGYLMSFSCALSAMVLLIKGASLARELWQTQLSGTADEQTRTDTPREPRD